MWGNGQMTRAFKEFHRFKENNPEFLAYKKEKKGMRTLHVMYLAYKNYQVASASTIKSYTTFFVFAKQALEDVKEEHVEPSKFRNHIQRLIYERANSRPIAQNTVDLWSSLTRKFYKDVYDFTFIGKKNIFNGGEVRLSKVTIDEG